MFDALNSFGISEDVLAKLAAAALLLTHILAFIPDEVIKKVPYGDSILSFLNSIAGNYGQSRNAE